jgi:peptide/nickel transport system permease protein
MIKLVGRRLLYLLPVLFGVALLTFLIASLLPGDLAYVLLGDQATPETLAALRHDLGLDQPILLRFAHWLEHVLLGDLGRSFRTGQTVVAAIAERLPVSIELMLLAEVGALAVAIPLAIVCAVREGGRFDRFVTGAAFASLSVPALLSAIVLIWLLAVRLEWLPATGYVPLDEDVGGNIRSFILPALTLVTVTGINIARLLGGAVIVEYIFALPGIGRLLIGSIFTRDLVLLQGVVLFVGTSFVLVNLAVDMLYAVLDPRIRHGRL